MQRPLSASNLRVDCKIAFMKKSCLLLVVISFLSIPSFAQRTITDFDLDWKFIQSDVSGAESTGFNDAAWRSLRVPHDWMIEGPYDRNNPTNRGGGYLPSGIGWYRKTFTIPATESNKKISIEFDGVMANSEVWINGKYHMVISALLLT
jgi:beta-galactosidase